MISLGEGSSILSFGLRTLKCTSVGISYLYTVKPVVVPRSPKMIKPSVVESSVVDISRGKL